jgi:hypothetical protein
MHDDPDVYSPVFLGGPSKGGGTLLQGMLSQAPGSVPLIGEAQFLRHLLEAYEEVVETWGDDPKFFFGHQEKARQGFRSALDTMIRACCETYDAHRVVLKAPEFVSHSSGIESLCPDAPRLAVLRDPRDVVYLQLGPTRCECSHQHEPSYLSEIHDPTAFDSPSEERLHIVVELAQQLNDLMPRDALAKWHCIAYEDLVTAPLETLSVAADAVGWDIGSEAAEFPWRGHVFDFLENASSFQACWRSANWGQPIRSDIIGVWKGGLSDAEGAAIEDTCRDYETVWTTCRIEHPDR